MKIYWMYCNLNNGYEKKFGCIKKEIYVDKENNYLKGIDLFLKTKDGYPIRYIFEFHKP